MKKYLRTVLMCCVTAATVFAAPTPILTKTNHPGFVHPDWAKTETCEVFTDSVVITHQLGYGPNAVTTTEKRDFTLTGDVQAIIAKAAKDSIEEKYNGLCDGPSTEVSAGNVQLFSTGGCGSLRKERQGGSAFLLRGIVDQFCPVTHDAGVIEQ